MKSLLYKTFAFLPFLVILLLVVGEELKPSPVLFLEGDHGQAGRNGDMAKSASLEFFKEKDLKEVEVVINDQSEIQHMAYEKQAKKDVPDEIVTFEITAYTAGEESTGKSPSHPEYGITASGKKVKENHTIACPPNMEFGTEVYIPDMDTTYVCEDRGSAITTGRLDIYMESVKEALKFGRRKMEVVIKE